MIIKAIEKAKAITQKRSALMIMSSRAIERGAKYLYRGPNGPTNSAEEPEFLLKFARDHRRYLQWLFEAKKRYGLPSSKQSAAVHLSGVRVLLCGSKGTPINK